MGKHKEEIDSDDEEEQPKAQERGRKKDEELGEEGKEREAVPVNKNKRYRKEKPWDHDGIDHWKVAKHHTYSFRMLLYSSSTPPCWL